MKKIALLVLVLSLALVCALALASCKKDENCEHDWDTANAAVTKAATCKEAGESTITCKLCGTTKTETVAKSTTHKWKSNYSIDLAASCTEPGQKSQHCSVCNAVKPESITEIPKSGHDLPLKFTVSVPKTCTTEGEEVKVCSSCEQVIEKQVIPASHNWNTEYTVDVEENCTTDGSKSIRCADCKEKKAESDEVIKATHTVKEGTLVYVPATVFATGSNTYDCGKCTQTGVVEILPKSSTVEEVVAINGSSDKIFKKWGFSGFREGYDIQTKQVGGKTVYYADMAYEVTILWNETALNVRKNTKDNDTFFFGVQNGGNRSKWVELILVDNLDPASYWCNAAGMFEPCNAKTDNDGKIVYLESSPHKGYTLTEKAYKDSTGSIYKKDANKELILEGGEQVRYVKNDPDLTSETAGATVTETTIIKETNNDYASFGTDYGWHRIAMVFHQEAYVEGGQVVYYGTLTLYLDGELATAYELDMSKFISKKNQLFLGEINATDPTALDITFNDGDYIYMYYTDNITKNTKGWSVPFANWSASWGADLRVNCEKIAGGEAVEDYADSAANVTFTNVKTYFRTKAKTN